MGRSQDLQDKILWELANNESRLTRMILRRRLRIKYADLDPVLEELEQDGRIRRMEQGFDDPAKFRIKW
jgi:DNA-binding HxlR family transcriptional regulator